MDKDLAVHDYTRTDILDPDYGLEPWEEDIEHPEG